MYLRIMNKLDYVYGQSYIDEKVSDAKCYCAIMREIERIVSILEDNYDGRRTAKDMGGYVIVITEQRESLEVRNDVLKYYKLEETDCEHSDVIAEDEQTIWKSELFLRSAEDSISIIYGQKKEVK